jgi:integrase
VGECRSRTRRDLSAGLEDGQETTQHRRSWPVSLGLKGTHTSSPGKGRGQPRADLNRPWEVVIKAAGLEGLRIHDLRHGFASVGAGSGLGLPILGKLLGHAQAATTNRYAHLASDPMHAAANVIGATIAAALGDG